MLVRHRVTGMHTLMFKNDCTHLHTYTLISTMMDACTCTDAYIVEGTHIKHMLVSEMHAHTCTYICSNEHTATYTKTHTYTLS